MILMGISGGVISPRNFPLALSIIKFNRRGNESPTYLGEF